MNFTEEQKNALMKYEELKLQIKSLEAELDPLKEIILPIMEKGQKLQGEKGFFTLMEKANWKFSSRITEKEKEIKSAKDLEIADGTAINKPTAYILYKESGASE